jgi:3-deoxy-D-manno-octulosonic-acid transferase
VRITGNTKFDSCQQEGRVAEEDLADLADSLGIRTPGPVWLAGSTHEGEEDKLLDVFCELRKTFRDLRFVVAPRYIERAERIQALATQRGLACALRSQGADSEPVVVLDSVGELRYAYRLATVVFVGGSFVHRGGQNILEPAACGRPVLFGPHMENFRGSVRVLIGRGGIQVPDAARLQRVMTDLLSRPEELEKLGTMAREAVTSVQGASSACTQAILELAERRSE